MLGDFKFGGHVVGECWKLETTCLVDFILVDACLADSHVVDVCLSHVCFCDACVMDLGS